MRSPRGEARRGRLFKYEHEAKRGEAELSRSEARRVARILPRFGLWKVLHEFEKDFLDHNQFDQMELNIIEHKVNDMYHLNTNVSLSLLKIFSILCERNELISGRKK